MPAVVFMAVVVFSRSLTPRRAWGDRWVHSHCCHFITRLGLVRYHGNSADDSRIVSYTRYIRVHSFDSIPVTFVHYTIPFISDMGLIHICVDSNLFISFLIWWSHSIWLSFWWLPHSMTDDHLLTPIIFKLHHFVEFSPIYYRLLTFRAWRYISFGDVHSRQEASILRVLSWRAGGR